MCERFKSFVDNIGGNVRTVRADQDHSVGIGGECFGKIISHTYTQRAVRLR